MQVADAPGMPVRNPRTGRIDAVLAATPSAALGAIAQRLRRAQAGWSAASLDERLAVLARWGELVANSAELLAALTQDTGRSDLSRKEVAAVRTLAARWAEWAPRQLAEAAERPSPAEGVAITGQLVPIPLAGFIAPWNSPLGLSLIDAVPALAAGCAALVKPSEITPRFVEPLRRTIQAEPELAAVLEFVVGDGRVGQALIEEVDLICFTGSVPTGRKVAEAAARRLIPCLLELGGKDPAIVLDGADVPRAAAGIVWSGTLNTGQLCHSIERVYAERPVFDPLVAAMVTEAERLALSWPDAAAGDIGPVIHAAQADIVAAHLDDARDKGALVLTGGTIERHGGGLWMRPTIVTGVNHTMRLMQEETFGPVLPVMAVADADEAVRLANDTVYGLSASVWGSEERAMQVARRIDAGGVSVNDCSLPAIIQDGEKMAFGVSGLGGSRMGATAIRRFVRRKAILTSRQTGRAPWWYA